MRVLFAILFQIFYFVSLTFLVKDLKIIKKSPYFLISCGFVIFGLLVNSITIYELYKYFTIGTEIESFLGGVILNIIALQISSKKNKNSSRIK